ncbi:hypothetical protein V1281_001977 [Nitrobacteraceae bacterium AZCC 2161]
MRVAEVISGLLCAACRWQEIDAPAQSARVEPLSVSAWRSRDWCPRLNHPRQHNAVNSRHRTVTGSIIQSFVAVRAPGLRKSIADASGAINAQCQTSDHHGSGHRSSKFGADPHAGTRPPRQPTARHVSTGSAANFDFRNNRAATKLGDTSDRCFETLARRSGETSQAEMLLHTAHNLFILETFGTQSVRQTG